MMFYYIIIFALLSTFLSHKVLSHGVREVVSSNPDWCNIVG